MDTSAEAKKQDSEMIDKIANKLLDCLKDIGTEDTDQIRRGFGLALSSVHGVMLGYHENSDEETKGEVSLDVWHTISTLMEAFSRDLERYKYKSRVEIGRILDGEPVPESKIQ